MKEPSDAGLKAGDYELNERDNRVVVRLMYPRNEGKKITRVEVDLCCVRASSSIIVSYCFQRDAWVIARVINHGYRLSKDQPSNLQSYEQEEEEIELALIPAWTEDTEAADARVISDLGKG